MALSANQGSASLHFGTSSGCPSSRMSISLWLQNTRQRLYVSQKYEMPYILVKTSSCIFPICPTTFLRIPSFSPGPRDIAAGPKVAEASAQRRVVPKSNSQAVEHLLPGPTLRSCLMCKICILLYCECTSAIITYLMGNTQDTVHLQHFHHILPCETSPRTPRGFLVVRIFLEGKGHDWRRDACCICINELNRDVCRMSFASREKQPSAF